MIRQELDSIVLAQIQVNRQRRPFVAVLKEMTFEKADDDACYLLSDGVVIGIAGQTSAYSLFSFFLAAIAGESFVDQDHRINI